MKLRLIVVWKKGWSLLIYVKISLKNLAKHFQKTGVLQWHTKQTTCNFIIQCSNGLLRRWDESCASHLFQWISSHCSALSFTQPNPYCADKPKDTSVVSFKFSKYFWRTFCNARVIHIAVFRSSITQMYWTLSQSEHWYQLLFYQSFPDSFSR